MRNRCYRLGAVGIGSPASAKSAFVRRAPNRGRHPLVAGAMQTDPCRLQDPVGAKANSRPYTSGRVALTIIEQTVVNAKDGKLRNGPKGTTMSGRYREGPYPYPQSRSSAF